MLRLFLDEGSDTAAKTGLIFLRIVSPFYMVISAKLIADGILRGAGLMKKFMVATFVDLLLRVVLASVLSRTAMGSLGIWASWPVGWVAAAVISLLLPYRPLDGKEAGTGAGGKSVNQTGCPQAAGHLLFEGPVQELLHFLVVAPSVNNVVAVRGFPVADALGAQDDTEHLTPPVFGGDGHVGIAPGTVGEAPRHTAVLAGM